MNSQILKIGLKIINPFIILVGIYIIFTGDSVPGGGFQGGVILATGFLTKFFISEHYKSNLKVLLKYEKAVLLIFILSGFASILIVGTPFKNYFMLEGYESFARVYFIIENTLIGLEVFLGFFIIFNAFIEEGS